MVRGSRCICDLVHHSTSLVGGLFFLNEKQPPDRRINGVLNPLIPSVNQKVLLVINIREIKEGLRENEGRREKTP